MKTVADFVDVSEGTISRWESGEIKNMKRNKIAKLSQVLKISPIELMGEIESISSEYTTHEQRLIESYRSANPITKQNIDMILGINEKEK